MKSEFGNNSHCGTCTQNNIYFAFKSLSLSHYATSQITSIEIDNSANCIVYRSCTKSHYQSQANQKSQNLVPNSLWSLLRRQIHSNPLTTSTLIYYHNVSSRLQCIGTRSLKLVCFLFSQDVAQKQKHKKISENSPSFWKRWRPIMCCRHNIQLIDKPTTYPIHIIIHMPVQILLPTIHHQLAWEPQQFEFGNDAFILIARYMIVMHAPNDKECYCVNHWNLISAWDTNAQGTLRLNWASEH